MAERTFLSGLGGGCAVPVAAFAECQVSGVGLTGLVISEDGKQAIKVTGKGIDALKLGHRLALQAISQGANEILAARVAK